MPRTSSQSNRRAHDLTRGWLVAVKERAYGPYPLDQLSGFIASHTWVFHPQVEDWRIAADVPALEKVLAARADQEPEWWFQVKGQREQGPYSRAALTRMVKEHALKRDTFVRHVSWVAAMPLLETPLAESLESEDALSPFRKPRFTKHVVTAGPPKASWKVDPARVPGWFVAAAIAAGILLFGTVTWWATTNSSPTALAYKGADRIVPERPEVRMRAGGAAELSLHVEKTDNAGRKIENDASPLQGGLVPVIDGQPALPGTPHSGRQPNGRLVSLPTAFRGGSANVIIAPAPTRSEDVLVLTQPGVQPVLVHVFYE